MERGKERQREKDGMVASLDWLLQHWCKARILIKVYFNLSTSCLMPCWNTRKERRQKTAPVFISHVSLPGVRYYIPLLRPISHFLIVLNISWKRVAYILYDEMLLHCTFVYNWYAVNNIFTNLVYTEYLKWTATWNSEWIQWTQLSVYAWAYKRV